MPDHVNPQPENRPGPDPARAVENAAVADLVAQADRYAAQLMAELNPRGYEQVQDAIAYAYAQGRHDGLAEGALAFRALLDAGAKAVEL